MMGDASYEEDFERIKDTYLNPTDGRVDKVIYDVVQEYTQRPVLFDEPHLKNGSDSMLDGSAAGSQKPSAEEMVQAKVRRSFIAPEHVQQTFYNLVSAKLNYPNENRQYSSAKEDYACNKPTTKRCPDSSTR